MTQKKLELATIIGLDGVRLQAASSEISIDITLQPIGEVQALLHIARQQAIESLFEHGIIDALTHEHLSNAKYEPK